MKVPAGIFSCVVANRKQRQGFAMAELIVVFVVMGLATALVSGLMSQVLKVGQRSAQTGAILELRNRVNSISKNPKSWLEKMRAKHALYSACIPDSEAATFAAGVFKCPDASGSDHLKKSDELLGKVAGPQLHVVSAPVVDIMGDLIAGTDQAPLYLDISGRVCENKDTAQCPLKSIGYFMRSNSNGSQNPGDIRFVVKVEKNLNSLKNGNTGAIKPEYLSIEIGQSWIDAEKAPIDGSFKVGYKLDGEAMYVKPGLSCGAGLVLTGIALDGKAECKSVPTGCDEGKGMLDPQTSNLVCAMSDECGAGQIHLGFTAGTGQAMCSSANLSCEEDQVQVGIIQQGSFLVADCKILPSCEDSQKISYDGSLFKCVEDVLAQNCPANYMMVGTNADKSPKCEAIQRGIAATGMNCKDGEYLQGFTAAGPVCKPFALAAAAPSPPPAPGTFIIWGDEHVALTEQHKNQAPISQYWTKVFNDLTGNKGGRIGWLRLGGAYSGEWQVGTAANFQNNLTPKLDAKFIVSDFDINTQSFYDFDAVVLFSSDKTKLSDPQILKNYIDSGRGVWVGVLGTGVNSIECLDMNKVLEKLAYKFNCNVYTRGMDSSNLRLDGIDYNKIPHMHGNGVVKQ